jgi:hypothetical protein
LESRAIDIPSLGRDRGARVANPDLATKIRIRLYRGTVFEM